MDDITIGVTENVNLISVTAQPNDQIIDIAVTETVETVLLDVSTTVQEVSVTATQNVIVENITVDYVNNENNIDINVTDATQDVTLNVTPTLIEINILRSGGEVNILQFNSLADFPTTGSSDYFYLAKDTNKLYRWTGSAYAEISATANAVWGQIIGTLSEQTDLQNALNLKAPINSPTFTGTVSGITKGMVGLGAVDNTSDLDKPISTATQTALNNKQPLDGDLTSIAALSGTFGLLKKTANNSYTIDTNTYLTDITSSDVTTALGFTPENAANKGIANGYASLNGDGKVPSSQLPSYVDDVIEVANYGSLPATGETGKIYITLDTNKIYRWSGSVYVEVSSSDAVWGAITGTLSNQTDLQNALNAKQDDLNGTGFVKASGTTISYDNTTYYPASNPNGYTSNTGTVTSVAMTVPSAFSVSGSPITSSGTLAVTATGDTTQYIAGDGSLVTFPTSSTAGTLIREVRNTTGATLTKGTVVYISGATGNKPTVSKAIAVGDSTSAQTFGLVQADIANNTNGNVVCAGDLTGIDTSTLTEGAQLYLSSTTAGAYTATKQLAPAHLVYIGIVTRAHPTLGQIEVNIQNGYELYELHDVSITSEVNNQGLFYEASTDLWKNKSIATVLGYTPANGADYVALSGTQTIAGNKYFTGFGLFDNTIFIKQDSSVSFLAGYNSIDSDSTGIIFSLPAGNMAKFILTSLTASRDYTLPNATGTIALTSDLSSYVPTSRTLTINGTTYDLSADRTWTISTTDSSKLPLTGGTLTGALNGTIISLSGSSSANALVVNQNSSYHAVQVNQSGTGAGIGIANSGNTDGLLITHTGGRGIRINSANAGFGIIINNDTASTSIPFVIQKSGATKISLTDAGAGEFASTITATQFIRSAGTSAQFLKADGSIDSSTYLTTGSASSTYLPLSGGTLTGALSGTSATFSDTADITANNSTAINLVLRGRAADSVGQMEFWNNAKSTRYGYIATDSTSMGIVTTQAIPLVLGTNTTVRLTIASTGAATFSSSVTAKNYGISEASAFRGGVYTFNQVAGTGTDYSVGLYSEAEIYLASGGSATKRLVLTSSGNVGIGTTSPGSLLTLYATTTPTIAFQNAGAVRGYLSADSGNNIYNAVTGNGHVFQCDSTERMRITSGGQVSINTSTVLGNNIKLNVNGRASFNMSNDPGAETINLTNYISGSAAYGIFVQGDAVNYSQYAMRFFHNGSGAAVVGSITFNTTNTGYNTSSDYRLKQDLKSFNGLEVVNKIKTYDYEWKANSTRSFGVLAHELQEVLPYAVTGEKDGEQMQGVDYSKIVPVLIQSIKDLKAELDTLKNK